MQLKEQSQKKIKDLKYLNLSIKKYLIKQLLASLRSMCYPAKMNFRKMHKGNLSCSFQCSEPETQGHIFQACQPILSRLDMPHTVNINYIYGSISEQKKQYKYS